MPHTLRGTSSMYESASWRLLHCGKTATTTGIPMSMRLTHTAAADPHRASARPAYRARTVATRSAPPMSAPRRKATAHALAEAWTRPTRASAERAAQSRTRTRSGRASARTERAASQSTRPARESSRAAYAEAAEHVEDARRRVPPRTRRRGRRRRHRQRHRRPRTARAASSPKVSLRFMSRVSADGPVPHVSRVLAASGHGSTSALPNAID